MKHALVLVALPLVALLLAAAPAGAEDEGPVCPNGLALSRIRGYESWTFLAAHLRTDKMEIRYLLANDVAAASFKDGAGTGGGKFAEGSIVVKVKYDVVKNPAHPPSLEPGRLKAVEYMVKNSARFSDTDGWGYAAFPYDASSGIFSAAGDSPTFHHVCHACHTEKVAHKDFVFTDWKHPAFLPFEKSLALPAPPEALKDLSEIAPPPAGEHEERAQALGAAPGGLKALTLDGKIEEGEYAFRAVLGDGALTLFWRAEGDAVAFGVEADTAGWVALGFEPDGGMKDADMIVGWVDAAGKAVVRDEFSTGRFGPHEPDTELGGRDDIAAFAGAETGGRTVLEFRRPRATGDARDREIPLDREFEILWALGADDDPAKKHDRRGEARIVLLGGGAAEAHKPVLWPIHAALMDLAIALLFVSMFIARRKNLDRGWLARHQTLGIVAPLILLAALGTAIYMVELGGGGHLQVPHTWLGVATLFFLLDMPVLGFVMLRAPNPETRATLRFVHVWMGRILLAALLVSSLTGLLVSGLI